MEISENMDAIHKLAKLRLSAQADVPTPLMRELTPATDYPVDALGNLLSDAARAIHDHVRAPIAMCAQSVLAAATLAVQAHVNIELPTGQIKPVSNFFMTVAASGERKSASDSAAMKPIILMEKQLRDEYDMLMPAHINKLDAWKKARTHAENVGKGNIKAIEDALRHLGPEPQAPLNPMLTCPEPTFEGLTLAFVKGQPSMGIFSDEGGQFTGGHAMGKDNKLKTAAGLSKLWDGEPIKRVRVDGGVVILPGRRCSAHLMFQPEVAMPLLSDDLLLGQGFMSRQLIVAPQLASGSRFWKEALPASQMALDSYTDQLLKILKTPLPLATGKNNELVPRVLTLSPAAREIWISYADHVEEKLGPHGEYASIRGLANKLPEHAARLAAVLAIVENPALAEVSAELMVAGTTLTDHYALEALRLFGASQLDPNLRLAKSLHEWLIHSWPEAIVSLPDIYQSGPNAIRSRNAAKKIVSILVDHGYLSSVSGGAIVAGKPRQEVFRIKQKIP